MAEEAWASADNAAVEAAAVEAAAVEAAKAAAWLASTRTSAGTAETRAETAAQGALAAPNASRASGAAGAAAARGGIAPTAINAPTATNATIATNAASATLRLLPLAKPSATANATNAEAHAALSPRATVAHAPPAPAATCQSIGTGKKGDTREAQCQPWCKESARLAHCEWCKCRGCEFCISSKQS